MSMFDNCMVFSLLIFGIAFLILYYKNEHFDSDFILILSIVLILTSLYFIVQKITGLGIKNKDGFRT